MNNMTSIEEIVKYQQALLSDQQNQKHLQKETIKLLNEINKNLTFMSDRLDEFAFKTNVNLEDATPTTTVNATQNGLWPALNSTSVASASSNSNSNNQLFFTNNNNLNDSINVIDISNLLSNTTTATTSHNTPNNNSPLSSLTKIEASSPVLTPLNTITTNTLNTANRNFQFTNNNNSTPTTLNNATAIQQHHQQQQQQQHHHHQPKSTNKAQKVKEYFLTANNNEASNANSDSNLLDNNRQKSQLQQHNNNNYLQNLNSNNTNGNIKQSSNFINSNYGNVNNNANTNPTKSPNKSNNISSLINNIDFTNSNQQQQQLQQQINQDQQKHTQNFSFSSSSSKLLDTTNLNSNGNKINTSDESIDDIEDYEESSDDERETIQFRKKPKLSLDSSPYNANTLGQTTKNKDNEESNNQQRLFNKYVRESVETRLGKEFLLLHEIQEIDQDVMEVIKTEALIHFPPINIRPRRAWHLAKASLRCRRRSLRRQKEKQISSTGGMSGEHLPQVPSTLTTGAVAAIATVANTVTMTTENSSVIQ
jgi:hypothetical protein